MEIEALLFNLIDSMPEPVLLLKKDQIQSDDEEQDRTKENELLWNKEYQNKLMKDMLKTKASGINNDKIPDYKSELEKMLPNLLNSYEENADSNIYLMREVGIFDSRYNIYFYEQEESLLIFFREIKLKEIFENITINSLGESCNSMIFILDSDEKIVDVNECFLKTFGVKKKDAIRKNFFESFADNNTEKLHKRFFKIIKNKQPYKTLITKYKTVELEQKNISWQFSKISRENKTYFVAVGSDVTRFFDEKREFANIKLGFEYFPFAIGYMNSNGIFTDMNPRFKKMMKITKDQNDVFFDEIAIFKKYIGFEKMKNHIKLIKEMSYNIDIVKKYRKFKLKVDIRQLSGKKKSSKLYIVIVQNITSKNKV